MLDLTHFAITLARTVELFRTQPDAVPEQKSALRALLALTKLGGASLALRAGRLEIDGEPIPDTLPAIQALGECFAELGVTEIRIAQRASAADLLHLVRALAAPPETYGGPGGVSRHLRDRASTVSVLSVESEAVQPGKQPMRVTEAFAAAGLASVTPERPRPQPRLNLDDALRRLVTVPERRDEAIAVLQAAGETGVAALRDGLIATKLPAERQAWFQALREMEGGTAVLVGLLDHDDPAVVARVAELLGRAGLEDAVPALGVALGHESTEVRRAAVRALVDTGSQEGFNRLRRAFKDGADAMRGVITREVRGRPAGALVPLLAGAAESETDLIRRREYYLALGRIGSPDAIQALIKAVQPGGRFLGRKAAGPRIAAVEALKLAGGPVALGTLEGLENDPDGEVRGVVRNALRDLQAKHR